MTSRRVLYVALVAGLALTAADTVAQPGGVPGGIGYALAYRAADSTLAITMTFAEAAAAPLVFVMPRSVPMGYGEQPYDEFVGEMAASGAGGAALTVAREDGPRWRIGRAGDRVARVTYRVDIARMEQAIVSASDTSRIRDGYLGVLGYSVFGYIEGREGEAVTLSIEGPEAWPVLTTLAPRVPPLLGRTQATAANFYALADSQIVMGPKADVRRVPAAVPLVLAVYAEGPVDVARIATLVGTAMERLVAYYGTTPFPHYTVHQELLAPISPRHQYGFSMEHLDSSTYYLARDQGLTAASTPADVTRVLYNFAHHISHAWIPKRAYGDGYYPFMWELAPVLDTIWFAEGFGQYAAIVAMAEGEAEPERYRQSMIDRRFRSVLVETPRFIRELDLIELSRIASTRYSQDFRTGRNVFARGGLMAAEMDDRIRASTGGVKSLKDGLRALVAWSERERRPFAIDDLPRIFEAATGVATHDILASGLGR